jgi:hypothetical protein
MNGDIVEALLEMHYHHAIVELFAQFFGARFLRMFKPSTQQEAWVGFDQGWVAAPSLSNEQLAERLSGAIKIGEQQIQQFYVGYFLQFKVLHEMSRRSRYAPSYSAPYLRSELSLFPNPSSGLSQHETLLRLSRVHNAFVYYACPRLFDLDEIYDPPDLSTVEIVDVSQAPAGWLPTERHFLAFRKSSLPSPQWLSEPIEAKSFACSEWVTNRNLAPSRRSGAEIVTLIQDCTSALSRTIDHDVGPRKIPQSFTILEFRIV